MTTIRELLDRLRAESLDERDKGDRFERLIRAYLLGDPQWTAKFSQVWLWSKWPGRDGRPDTGIDLVCERRDGDGLAAVQCKFYAETATVAKRDIDSFLSASSTGEFSARYVFDTAGAWSINAQETIERQQVPVSRIDIGYLDDARVDWDRFSWDTPEVIVPTGPHALKDHQSAALDDVIAGLAEHERGKLIMACGTGKTFTSLKIAEAQVGAGGSVLFLVPSIQLLSQSLREWMAQAAVTIRPFAVCSDVRVGRRNVNQDDADMSPVDLAEPATTDASTLAARVLAPGPAHAMTVVFATYQSIDVVASAQQQGVGAFDLVICDEAHRTTGVTLVGDDDSAFVRVHDQNVLKAKRRLYMTATPRVFGEGTRQKAADADAVLASMDDESFYGPELHRLGFGDAVAADLLTDYKVLVLAVDEQYVAENFQTAMAAGGEIALDDAAKLIGCWNGLSKNYRSEDQSADDGPPMRRAVAFAKTIKASKTATESFPVLVDRVLETQPESRPRLEVRAQHVDGTMGVHDRNARLAWLKADPEPGTCRILTNARCLSEGVDVPALDAVLFLTPRGSQVDVVQSVGRVMRLAPGKQLGYIVLPIVVPSGMAPEDALADNERYRVVWQVLQALRSHDDRFHAMVNSIELNKRKPDRLIIDKVAPAAGSGEGKDGGDNGTSDDGGLPEQLRLNLSFDQFRDGMFARIVKKVGERRYWETWAKDIADIAQAHITRINGLLANPDSPASDAFGIFLDGLRANLNESITQAEAVEMLAQHLVTRPVFEALFAGYDFTAHNPVAQTMERMLATLDEHNLDAEAETLDAFYASVRRRVEGVTDAAGKQRVVVELYDKFFATAFKKTVDKLGIVYTPVEIVDFILRSADRILRDEFGQGLTDEGVHILDGFTGTGTFVVRLLQSGLIEPHDLARKYANELHANEILLLAYYIAAVNIETAYADLAESPAAFSGLILTDTFQSWEDEDRPDLDVFPENNARLERLKTLPITVIVGNPPYSSGQDSANDDNQNQAYPSLDARIRDTYAARSTSTSVRSLYDSYIRAIKWATLRIEQSAGRGVIAYVTNGGFLDSNAADGMRLALADDFSAIHVFNLRGNQRTSGEQSRREGGKIFGGGSRATVAISVFVKDPERPGPATIHYTDVGDGLTREQKLQLIDGAATVVDLESVTVTPNDYGDWIAQRRDDFGEFPPLAAKSGSGETGIFVVDSHGLTTNRDAWVYNASPERLEANVRTLIDTYRRAVAGQDTNDARKISWSRGLRSRARRKEPIEWAAVNVRTATYRPFTKMNVYLSSQLNEVPAKIPTIFPTAATPNLGIYQVGSGSAVPFSVLMLDTIPDLHVTGAGSGGRFFARWTWEQVGNGRLDLGAGSDDVVIDGYRRIDNIADSAHQGFADAYPTLEITKDDLFFYVYGLLHSTDYRNTYEADLTKMLPRIPLARDFAIFADAGRRLADLHTRYDTADPYPLDGLASAPPSGADPYEFYAVSNKRMRAGKPTAAQKAAGLRHDRTILHFNDSITLSGIPDEAHGWTLGSRSAIEWIIDRYLIATDKPSGIVNDLNDWSRQVGDPRYILDLFARIVTVSVATVELVDSLPPLDLLNAD